VSAVPVRDVRHLGDFSVTPRLLVIIGLAVPIGAVSACVAWALLKLIGPGTRAGAPGAAGRSAVGPALGLTRGPASTAR
jgi:hypothetical protein